MQVDMARAFWALLPKKAEARLCRRPAHRDCELLRLATAPVIAATPSRALLAYSPDWCCSPSSPATTCAQLAGDGRRNGPRLFLAHCTASCSWTRRFRDDPDVQGKQRISDASRPLSTESAQLPTTAPRARGQHRRAFHPSHGRRGAGRGRKLTEPGLDSRFSTGPRAAVARGLSITVPSGGRGEQRDSQLARGLSSRCCRPRARLPVMRRCGRATREPGRQICSFYRDERLPAAGPPSTLRRAALAPAMQRVPR